jgi:hypothetical protein
LGSPATGMNANAQVENAARVLPQVLPHDNAWMPSLLQLESDRLLEGPMTRGDLRDMLASLTTELRDSLLEEQKKMFGETVPTHERGASFERRIGHSSRAKVKAPKPFLNPKASRDCSHLPWVAYRLCRVRRQSKRSYQGYDCSIVP